MTKSLKTTALEEMRGILQKELQERQINPLFIPIVNQYLDNVDIEDIARNEGLNVLEVSLLLEKPEIKTYINQCIQQVGYLNRKRRIDLINKVIDQKIEEAEEYDTALSKKDLLEWLKLLEDTAKNIQAQKPKTAVQVNQHGPNNTVQLIEDLLNDS